MKRETKEEIILATKKACARAVCEAYPTKLIYSSKVAEICMNVNEKDIKIVKMEELKKQEEEQKKWEEKIKEKQSKCLHETGHRDYECIDHNYGWDTMRCNSCGKTWGKSSSSYNRDY